MKHSKIWMNQTGNKIEIKKPIKLNFIGFIIDKYLI